MSKLLVIDTESGGLDPNVHSILSLGAVVWDNGVIRDEMEVLILEEVFVVTAQALKVNRINLIEHAEVAAPPVDALNSLVGFIGDHFAPGQKVPLVAHNAEHDVGFVRRLIRLANSELSFDDLFSHRKLDTAGILRFLHLAGHVPQEALSSTGGFEYFDIEVPDNKRHTSLGDARATAELLTRMVSLIQK